MSTLAEHTLYLKLNEDMNNLSGSITSFQMNSMYNYQNIQNVLYNFDSTTDTFFDTSSNTLRGELIFSDTTNINDLIMSLRQNANDYIPVLRRNGDTTQFLDDIKAIYIDSTEVQDIYNIDNYLGINDSVSINNIRVLPREFVKNFEPQILSACLMKIVEDYGQYDEFNIAANLAVIQNNMKVLDITDKYQQIQPQIAFLFVNYPLLENRLIDFLANLSSAMNTLTGLSLDENGELDIFTGGTGMFEYLTQEQVNNIIKVLKTIQLILNATINEIRIVTGDEEIYLYNTYASRTRVYIGS